MLRYALDFMFAVRKVEEGVLASLLFKGMAINPDSRRLIIIPVINYYSASFPNPLGHLRALSTITSVNWHWD